MSKSKKYTIGVDLGGTNIRVGLVNDQGKIVIERALLTKDYCRQKEKLIQAITGKIKEVINELGLRRSDIKGVGIGMPGLVDTKQGIIHYLVNIPGWNNVPLKKLFEERLHIPVFVDNDVNIMALGEFVWGAGRGAKNLVCLTLGTGVGGAIIMDGKLYRGSTLSAGEIGHTPLNMQGPECNCGGRACLERYIGSQYIVQETIKRIKKGKKTIIARLVNNKLFCLTPEILSKAAREGDKLAIEIWQEVGRYLGVALVSTVNLLNPERIVIGGGVSKAGKVLFDTVKKTIRERAMKLPAKTVKIVKAKLGEKAGVIGAAVLVKDRIRTGDLPV